MSYSVNSWEFFWRFFQGRIVIQELLSFYYCAYYLEQVSKVIWQDAVSSSCHPSRRRINSSDFDTYLIIWFPGPTWISLPNSISIGSACFARLPMCPTYTHRHVDHAIRTASVAIGCICALHKGDAALKCLGVALRTSQFISFKSSSRAKMDDYFFFLFSFIWSDTRIPAIHELLPIVSWRPICFKFSACFSMTIEICFVHVHARSS